ncbi:hypothetical protein V6D40_09565 [Corynebacterium sp. Q4381]|uniref:hypothetical protein n=1 Tax=Corynebacterium sp. Marseille-Q4381 TaxID=3121597 RepID=UPI002FE5701A
MTNQGYGNYPSYGGDPQGGDNPGYNGYNDYSGNNGYSEYSQFEVNSAEALSGADAQRFHGTQFVDGYYGDGATPHPINDPTANGWTHTKGTGKLKVGQAVGWGFNAYQANPGIWLIVGLVLAAIGLVSDLPALAAVGPLVSLVGIFLEPLFVSAGLQQTLTKNFKGIKTPAYGKTLGMLIVVSLLFGFISGIVFLIGFLIAIPFMNLDPALFEDPTAVQDPAAVAEVLGQIAPGFIIGGLLVLLVLPFAVYPIFYAADNAGTFGNALGQGIKAGGRNYGQTLLLVVILGALTMLTAVPSLLTVTMGMNAWFSILLAFLLTVVISPLRFIIGAHAYRQVSGGPVPHETTA